MNLYIFALPGRWLEGAPLGSLTAASGPINSPDNTKPGNQLKANLLS